jgi:hypothetical protein
MLYFIAQPTRANPEYLPQYQPIYGNRKEAQKRPQKPKTGEEILLELIS